MVFSSLLFLYVFLPIIIILYFVTPQKFRNMLLLIASLFFYAWGEPKYVVLMIISIIFNYFMGLLIESSATKSKRTIWVATAVILNIAILGYYKYAGFFITVIEDITGYTIPFEAAPLPIGISFYTFQALSYIIDVYRKDVKAQRSIIDLSLFITLFPQLIAGPIVRYQTIADQIKKRVILSEDIMIGTQRFLQGLAKKVLLANPMGEVADQIFMTSPNDLTTATAWLGILSYAMQIYFDFSGYSDMAIGLARIFGFKFEENFNYPYISQSITEFWRRWHISLGTWFKDYVYFPLGGSRVNKHWKLYRNLFIVWALTGLWHGAAWTYIVWGLYFGVLIMLEKWVILRWLERIPRVLRHGYLLFMIALSWIIFRSETFSYAVGYFKTMFLANGQGLYDYQTLLYVKDYAPYFIIAIILAMPVYRIYCDWVTPKMENSLAIEGTVKIGQALYYTALLVIITMFLVNATHNPFIYFRF